MWLSRRGRLVPGLLVPLVLLALVLSAAVPAAADGPTTQEPQSYIVVDGDSGAIVAAKEAHTPHLTASTVKVLTALVTVEHLPSSATLHVSALAASQPASKIDMKEGSDWPLEQAVASLMMVSANDAAYAMAENVGGTLANFAAMANATGKRLGLRDTTFADPAGLDGRQGFGGGTTSSAYDLAIVARNALTVPAIAEPAARVTYEFTDPNGVGRRLTNHNRGFLTGYPGAIGLKTGFTTAASRTLIAVARRDGHTCISVVMGTWDDSGWASHLLDQCFAGSAPAGAEQLPPVRITTADARLATVAALPRTLGARAAVRAPGTGSTAAGTAAAEKPAPPPAGPDAASEPEPALATGAAAAGTGAPAGVGSGGWTLRDGFRTAGLVLAGLLVVLVLLRRRAVRRRRSRRLARQRAHAEARRRGMIDVVETDDSEIRLMPTTTTHHVAASGRRHPSERRIVRPTRPRDHAKDPRR